MVMKRLVRRICTQQYLCLLTRLRARTALLHTVYDALSKKDVAGWELGIGDEANKGIPYFSTLKHHNRGTILVRHFLFVK